MSVLSVLLWVVKGDLPCIHSTSNVCCVVLCIVWCVVSCIVLYCQGRLALHPFDIKCVLCCVLLFVVLCFGLYCVSCVLCVVVLYCVVLSRETARLWPCTRRHQMCHLRERERLVPTRSTRRGGTDDRFTNTVEMNKFLPLQPLLQQCCFVPGELTLGEKKDTPRHV